MYWHNRVCKIVISVHNFIAGVELKSIFLYIFIDFDKIKTKPETKKTSAASTGCEEPRLGFRVYRVCRTAARI